ncbi:MAG: hypothetical protein LBG48_03780 [Rickettsiales bacterium]|jgi:hypothetical protein|nr:hypothetical protein [Rickettsiales bacterium]
MLKYAKITNQETKACSVGLGINESYYKKIGYEQMDVEKGYDDIWYLSGYTPTQSLDELKQIKLDELKENNESYILSIYPEYRQRNIGIFGTEEERNEFKDFKDSQVGWYDSKIEEINECETLEDLNGVIVSVNGLI